MLLNITPTDVSNNVPLCPVCINLMFFFLFKGLAKASRTLCQRQARSKGYALVNLYRCRYRYEVVPVMDEFNHLNLIYSPGHIRTGKTAAKAGCAGCTIA